MGISNKCWYGILHKKCNYYDCICDCHLPKERMFELLQELELLNRAQRKKHPDFNPHPPKLNKTL